MRTVLAYIVLIATLLPTFSQWGTIAYYHANKDYIAKVLCENRAKPQLRCDGHCYLAKRLNDQQKQQDEATTERVQKTPDFQLFYQLGGVYSFSITVPDVATEVPDYLLKSYQSPRFTLLHPPQV